jgi:DNA mismatch endonuclease (patch repair protein)
VPRWRKVPPQPGAWRAPAGLTPAQRAAEQDRAADGHERRQLLRPDGRTVTASIALRHPPSSRRIYAYLRWSASPGRTRERYVGEVTEPSREGNLRLAWARVHDLSLLRPPPRAIH